jgi:hypothetical protein
MGGDRVRNTASEVLIDRRRGVSRQQGDALLDRSAQRGWRVQNGYSQGTILDDDLGTRAHVCQQHVKVPRGLGYRDVDCRHMHDDTAVPSWFASIRASGLTTVSIAP